VFTMWAGEVYPYLLAEQEDMLFTPTLYLYLVLFFASMAAFTASFVRTVIFVARLMTRRTPAVA
jgi:hypothetical protein